MKIELITKESFLTYVDYDAICRAVLNRLEAADLSFDEIFEDPRQLSYPDGVPSLIRDTDVMMFARLHTFNMQMLAFQNHFEIGAKLMAFDNAQDYASYLVDISVTYLRHCIDAYKVYLKELKAI